MRERESPRIEIQQYGLFSRLFRRFKVIGSGRGQAYLSREIVPVVSMDDLAEDWGWKSATSATIAIGAQASITALPVPKGKRWKVQRVRVNRATGDNLVDGIRLYDASTGIGAAVIDFSTPASLVSWDAPGTPYVLSELDEIRYSTDGSGSATSTFVATAWYTEIDAFAGD